MPLPSRTFTIDGGRVTKDALLLACQTKKKTFFFNFIQSPLVLLSLLAMSWGVNYIVTLMDPFFLPPTILSCLLIFLFLCVLSKLSPVELDDNGDRLERRKYVAPILTVIEKPMDLILKHMSVCFTPAFILIPSGRKLPGNEVGLLIAWFLVSFILAFLVSLGIHRTWDLLASLRPNQTKPHDPESLTSSSNLSNEKLPYSSESVTSPAVLTRDWARKGSDATFVNTPTDPTFSILPPRKSSNATMVNSSLDLKGLGFSESAMSKDGSDIGDGTDQAWVEKVDVGLQEVLSKGDGSQIEFSPTSEASLDGNERADEPATMKPEAKTSRRPSFDDRLSVPRPSYEPGRTITSRPSTPFPSSDVRDINDLATRDLLQAKLAASLDISLYIFVFLVSIPIFYTTKCSVPLFLSLNILIYLLVIKNISVEHRQFAHPIIVTSLCSVLLIWGFGASIGWSLQESLASYSTGSGYIELWAITPPPQGRAPGAGDILVDALDAGIIALALPLYRFRADLKRYFFRMLFLVVPSAILSLFVWPLGARAFGLQPEVALAFVGRFSSTPLAKAQVSRVGGDESLTVVIVVVTGIVVVILQKWIFRALRIKPDDFLALGLLFGVTSGAIGASGLLNSGQKRAAAIASLTFAIFGTVILVALGIPPAAAFVQKLIGLS